MAYTIEMNQGYINEMNKITKSLSSYSGYVSLADSLKKIIPDSLVAGLIGCIVPESGTNHRILNEKEFYGRGASGTSGWNCGEGLIQWTHWNEKLPLIQKYNKDSRSTQKLPETWDEYSKGEPVKVGKQLLAVEDGKHIAGLSVDNQMLFLTIYYNDLLNSLKSESNLATITARIYQQKAGIGFYRDIKDPIVRAYTTSANKYPCSEGNHYLQSLKIAQEYSNYPIVYNLEEEYVSYPTNYVEISSGYGSNMTSYSYGTNNVSNLASATRKKETLLQQTEIRKDEFNNLRTRMTNNLPGMGRQVLLSEELYDSNILKGDQESKKDRS